MAYSIRRINARRKRAALSAAGGSAEAISTVSQASCPEQDALSETASETARREHGSEAPATPERDALANSSRVRSEHPAFQPAASFPEVPNFELSVEHIKATGAYDYAEAKGIVVTAIKIRRKGILPVGDDDWNAARDDALSCLLAYSIVTTIDAQFALQDLLCNTVTADAAERYFLADDPRARRQEAVIMGQFMHLRRDVLSTQIAHRKFRKDFYADGDTTKLLLSMMKDMSDTQLRRRRNWDLVRRHMSLVKGLPEDELNQEEVRAFYKKEFGADEP